MKKNLIMILAGIIFVILYSNYTEASQKEIVLYGDYKCPYCKKVEEKIMPEIQKNYINTGKAKFKFVNVSFLGKDSIKGSRAGHAVQNIAPSSYLEFQKEIYSKQPNDEKAWITYNLLDNQIDKLNISKSKKDEIKKDYKTKNSKSWQDAKRDVKISEKKKIKMVPTVFIDGKKIKDVHNIEEYKKVLDN